MRRRKLDRELQRVVDRVLRLVPVDRAVTKQDFEAINAEVLACVEEKTGASPEQLAALIPKVLADLPGEYGQLNESQRSWPALIVYLYAKYLKELAAG
jgi:hypothetical protein